MHPWAGLAIPAHTGDDEAGIPRPQDVGANAEAVHDPRPIVLDKDIGVVDEAEQQVAARIGLEVDAHALLARVRLGKVGGHAVRTGNRGASDVALGWLDLDDLGTEVAQDPGGVGPGEDAGEVEHAYARQRSGRRRAHSRTVAAPLLVHYADVRSRRAR